MNRRVCFVIAALVSLRLFSGILTQRSPPLKAKRSVSSLVFPPAAGSIPIPGPLRGTWANISPVILRSLWKI